MQLGTRFARDFPDHFAKHAGKAVENIRRQVVRSQYRFASAGKIMLSDVVCKEIPISLCRVEQKIGILNRMKASKLAAFVHDHQASATVPGLRQKQLENV